MQNNLQLSLVIPLFNEEESLPELFSWIKKVCTRESISFEVIFVDDGSKDKSWEVVSSLAEEHTEVRGIRFRRNYGKSAALNEGFAIAEGDVVITMDADLQDSPEEIPDLIKMIVEDGYDLVSGWKKKRYDPLSKTIPTKLFNAATRKMSGIYLHDFNCGLKAYKNDVVKSIEVYGEMHRYIPVLSKRAGFTKIGEKVVQHQARKYGTSKFGFERFLNGFLDLLTITFVSKFGKRPMHFFGLIGSLMFLLGSLVTVWMGIQKLYYVFYVKESARLITDQPIFYVALTLAIIGVQFFLAGFLGELVSRNAPDRNVYLYRETIRAEEKP
ncbi:glycosyltransferase family 2 protein [Luteibaculum oceani]|uniref:Glycosyltransferase family 2 protein n=1 Tax=Luteibaculum oceani TaxID=1294296 RepID=A0A5C6VC03_9FLAO|nr:glycosyltransferase family 2 protein [Luteibaculum oceani]TXC82056.1 glycosyltransferase family 2 protein [Luteibaculum oceani]